MATEFVDPLEASTRLGPASSAPASAPAAEFVDPLEASQKIGSPLKTSYKQVPTRESSGSLWGDFTHGLGLGTRNVIEGVSALPGMAVDAATWPGRAIIRGLGGTSTAPSDMLNKGLDAAGLPKPETEGEKTRAEFIRGGASMLGPMAMGAVPSLAAKVPAIVRPFVSMDPGSGTRAATQVVGGGVGAVAGDAAANDERVPEGLKPTVRLMGNMAGTVGTNTLAGAAGTLTNAYKGVQSEIANALDRLGIKPRTVGAVSESPGMQGAEGFATRLPIAGGVLQPKQRQVVDEFGNAVEDTARRAETATNPKMPVISSPQDAGMVVQREARNWRDNVFPAREDAAWKPVNDVMRPAGDVVDPASYRAALQRAAADVRLANLPETQKAFASGQIQKWLDALDADAPAGTKISWDAAHAIKRRVGEALGTPDLVASIGDKALNSLYGGLAQDMKISAVLAGAGKPYDAANEFSTAGRTFINKTLSKAISGSNAIKEEISPDNAAMALLRGDATDLQALRLVMPEAADALAALKLRQIGQAKPSQQGAGDTPSTGSFLTELRRAQGNNPEGTSALFSHPDVAQNVKDLATVAAQLRKVERNMSVSQTPGGMALASGSSKLVEALLSGDPKQIAMAAGVLGGPYLTAKFLSNPAVVAITKAQRPAAPAIPGLLGGAIVNQATGPARYDYTVRPDDRQ